MQMQVSGAGKCPARKRNNKNKVKKTGPLLLQGPVKSFALRSEGVCAKQDDT